VVKKKHLLLEALRHYGVAKKHWVSIKRYLDVLGARNEETGRHSIRVGLLAARIGEYLEKSGIKAKTLLWAGLLHDIGKALVDPDLFGNVGKFTEADYKRMEPHVEYGFRILRGTHQWTAHIIVRHHRFGKRPYPDPLPESFFSPSMDKVFDKYARILALADYYDALMTRDNEKFGKRKLSPAEKREQYLKDNSDQRNLILELEKAGILTFSA